MRVGSFCAPGPRFLNFLSGHIGCRFICRLSGRDFPGLLLVIVGVLNHGHLRRATRSLSGDADAMMILMHVPDAADFVFAQSVSLGQLLKLPLLHGASERLLVKGHRVGLQTHRLVARPLPDAASCGCGQGFTLGGLFILGNAHEDGRFTGLVSHVAYAFTFSLRLLRGTPTLRHGGKAFAGLSFGHLLFRAHGETDAGLVFSHVSHFLACAGLARDLGDRLHSALTLGLFPSHGVEHVGSGGKRGH